MGTALLVLAFDRFHARTGTVADRWVLGEMVAHRNAGLTAVAVAVTNAGSPLAVAGLAVVIGCAMWWHFRSVLMPLVLIATVGAAGVASTALKLIVGASRPPSEVQLLPETDPSFPSGHVTGTLTLLGIALVLAGAKASPWARACGAATLCVGVVLVATTRLYLGVHWLTDILGGLLLGGLAIMAGSKLFRCLQNWSSTRASEAGETGVGVVTSSRACG